MIIKKISKAYLEIESKVKEDSYFSQGTQWM